MITANPVLLAKILNFFFFDGREVILPSELEAMRTDQELWDAYGRLHGLSRDCLVKWVRGNLVFALLGVESQSVIDKDMPLRVIGYDGGTYWEQLKNPNGERYPVITLVLYYGKEPWNKYLTLKERLNIPPEYEDVFSPYVNDYRIHVIDFRRLSLDDIKKLGNDLGFIASVYYKIEHPTEEVELPAIEDEPLIIQFFKVFLGDEIAKTIPLDKLRQGGATVDELVADFKQMWREEGREEERQATVQQKKRSAHKLLEQGFSSDKIADILEEPQAMIDLWLDERC